jgi:hypothetical protein
MIAKWWLLAFAAGTLEAAVIRGVVVEHMTGKPLMRANVTVLPIPGTPGSILSVRTDRFGGFTFSSLAAGAYAVNVGRFGFATTQYGQKEWKSAGRPIVLEASESAFLNVRLRRLGSITGTVVDEEDVGLPDHEVIVYRDTQPPELVTRARTDDRGNYRLSGLMPGKYLVRSVGKQYDEGAYLPTFSRETAEAEQALRFEVNLDEQTNHANLKPRPGRLISISGVVSLSAPGLPMTVTLVNDMGRHEQKGFSPMVRFRFDNMPPGEYELFGKASDGTPAGALFSGYRAITAPPGKDVNLSMQLAEVHGTGVQLRDKKGGAVDLSQIQVLARTRDLAGAGDTQPIQASPAMLAPGRWELALAPNPSYAALEFIGPLYAREPGPAYGWHEIFVTAYPRGARWILSNAPAGVRGIVSSPGHDPVAGAPVFLEEIGVDSRKRLIEIHTTRTDLRGQYHFAGLTPGSYRLLATFEYQMPDSAAMEVARAQSVRVDDGQVAQLDLELYEIR